MCSQRPKSKTPPKLYFRSTRTKTESSLKMRCVRNSAGAAEKVDVATAHRHDVTARADAVEKVGVEADRVKVARVDALATQASSSTES